MGAMTFMFVKSGEGLKNTDEDVSGLKVAVTGAMFSAVCARCISGRRCVASVTATGVGSGGRGAVGGGTGGGLQSARRDLKNRSDGKPKRHSALARPSKRDRTKTKWLLTASRH